MRLNLLALLILLSGFLIPISASQTIGYSNGEVAKNSSFSIEGNENVSGAIYLPPSYLSPYEGCEIIALRAALASKVNIDNLKIWARTSLEGENLVEVEITSKTEPSLAKGWMEVNVDVPYKINATEGLYLGMTYHQKAAANAFSLIGTGFENSFYAKLGDDANWIDSHENGILSLEAVLDGEINIDYDLALMSATVDASSDVQNNIVKVLVANTGQKDITGFTLVAIYEDDLEKKFESQFNQVIPSGEKVSVDCVIPKMGDILTNPLTIYLGSIYDGEDVIKDNNSVRCTVPAIKKVFVEEYTTELCSNCPRVAGYLHEVSNEEAYLGKIVIVCHHSGYYTDWLTQDCDLEMEKFYNLTFAPAVSYDRYPYFNGRIMNTPEKSDLRNTFDKVLEKEPGTKIIINSFFDTEARMLNVDVNVERLALSMASPHLTVYIVENNVQPHLQSGDKDGTFIHNHVIRDYNSTWGDPITWNGSNFNASYSFDIDKDWKEEDMRIVAIVNNYNSDDQADNVVDNAEEVAFVQASGVESFEANKIILSTDYFDLNGRKVSKDAKGLLIKRIVLTDGKQVTTKVMNK